MRFNECRAKTEVQLDSIDGLVYLKCGPDVQKEIAKIEAEAAAASSAISVGVSTAAAIAAISATAMF